MQGLTKPRHGLISIMDPDRREFIKEIISLLNDFFGGKLVSVIVFGSVARGDAKPTSDTDILVVAENLPRRMSEKMEIMARILIKLRNTQVYRELRKKGINTWVQFYLSLRKRQKSIDQYIWIWLRMQLSWLTKMSLWNRFLWA